jgi:aminoglycoside phosphotransferase (APT) family kinase protein
MTPVTPVTTGETEPTVSVACDNCAERLELRRGVLDLELGDERPPEPAPLEHDEAGRALAALEGGKAWRSVLEALLLELPFERAGRLMQLLHEGRGAWFALLFARGGSALLVGNALSGTAAALARTGFDVTSLDDSPARLALAGHRNRALVPERPSREVLVGGGDRLPFPDEVFDLVVREVRFDAAATGRAEHSLAECRRVARGEVLMTADNRLGYKVSSGRRGEFRRLSALAWLRSALRADGRHALSGYRGELRGPGFEPPRAFSLYPHSRDFTHVAAIDEHSPRLYVGPKERDNPLKILAYRAGLFPLFTPSFALTVRRTDATSSVRRVERLLEGLAARLGEPRPEAVTLLATRGNNALVMTAPRKRPGPRDPDPAGHLGRWIVRIPLHFRQARLVEREHVVLSRLRRDFPDVPTPEPLFMGEIEGLFLTCERRLGGHSAAQFSGAPERMASLYEQAADHLARLVVAPDVLVTDEVFEELVGARYEITARTAGCDSTRQALARMHELARETLLGQRLPRVLRHSDLRSKHVQIEPNGNGVRVLGYYGWGASEDSDLPYYDLLHLIVHERANEAGTIAGEAWQLVRGHGAGLRPRERAALDAYAERLGLTNEVRTALEEIYPMLVGAMAECSWDYSRPRWLHRGFRL